MKKKILNGKDNISGSKSDDNGYETTELKTLDKFHDCHQCVSWNCNTLCHSVKQR